MKSVDIRTLELGERIEHGAFRANGTSVSEPLGGTRIGGSLYEVAAGDRLFPYHYHYGIEEWLIVVGGTPTLRTPEGEQVLRAGDCVCFPVGPEGAHALYGPGRVLMLSTAATTSVSIPIYPDSDKLGVRPGVYDSTDNLTFRRSDAVGYWEGE